MCCVCLDVYHITLINNITSSTTVERDHLKGTTKSKVSKNHLYVHKVEIKRLKPFGVTFPALTGPSDEIVLADLTAYSEVR